MPYQINSYLETEIQNADKTETMDKSILNIKSSTDLSYEQFTSVSTPITLLDDQVAGNDISHTIDLRLKGNIAHKKDVYKATIKFEVKQK